jgi:hypothetical protein
VYVSKISMDIPAIYSQKRSSKIQLVQEEGKDEE